MRNFYRTTYIPSTKVYSNSIEKNKYGTRFMERAIKGYKASFIIGSVLMIFVIYSLIQTIINYWNMEGIINFLLYSGFMFLLACVLISCSKKGKYIDF